MSETELTPGESASSTQPTPPAAPTPVAPTRSGWTGTRITSVIVGVVIAGLIGVLATRRSALERESVSQLLGREAPAFSGKSILDGRSFSLQEQQGKWVVLNVFATWCTPCVREHPELVEFQKSHAGTDVELVSIVFDDQAGDVRSFFTKRGGTWPVLQDPKVLVDYGITGVPETFLISPAGQILWKVNRQITRARLDEALATGRKLFETAPGSSSPTSAP
jgi:cytochrome c biogenesis protein CcmG, thiol:disulfide interchange protein DsbE